uniref:Glycosyltransferase n=1 Tax=viral metagenome TaxID=1070528 RepID=A0A6M3L1A5_9ZZZZ
MTETKALKETKAPKVLVFMPNYEEKMDRRVVMNRLGMVRQWERMGIATDDASSGRIFIQFARTDACHLAVERGYTHILMLDDDAVADADILPRWLAFDKDIIGAPYVGRTPPYPICAKVAPDGNIHDAQGLRNLRPDEMGQGLIPVDTIGTHAMLVKVDMLMRRGTPDPDDAARRSEVLDLDDEASFVEEHNEGKPIFVMPKRGTEDMYFCYRARRKGFGVYCDTDRFARHIGSPPMLGIEVCGRGTSCQPRSEAPST